MGGHPNLVGRPVHFGQRPEGVGDRPYRGLGERQTGTDSRRVLLEPWSPDNSDVAAPVLYARGLNWVHRRKLAADPTLLGWIVPMQKRFAARTASRGRLA